MDVMGSLPAQDPGHRGGPRRYLLVADPHYERERDPADDSERLGTLYEDYDCDEVLVAGDVGSFEDVEAMLEGEYEATAVRGNNDTWDVDAYEHDGTFRYLADGGRVFYADEAAWNAGPYTVQMQHRPHDFNIRATSGRDAEPDTDADIVIHGHSHMPAYRVLGDGTLAVGAGSLSQNYHVADGLPDRSVQVVEIDADVTVHHIDADTEEVVETVTFRYDDGFVKTAHDTDWDGHRFER